MSVYVVSGDTEQISEINRLQQQVNAIEPPSQSELLAQLQRLSVDELVMFWEMIVRTREAKRKLRMVGIGLASLAFKDPEIVQPDFTAKLDAMRRMLDVYSGAYGKLNADMALEMANLVLYRKGVEIEWTHFMDRDGEPVLDSNGVPMVETKKTVGKGFTGKTIKLNLTDAIANDVSRLRQIKTYMETQGVGIGAFHPIVMFVILCVTIIGAFQIFGAVSYTIKEIPKWLPQIFPPDTMSDLVTWLGVGFGIVCLGIGLSFVLR